MSLKEKLIQTCKNMPEDMLVQVVCFAEYIQYKNKVKENSKGEEVEMEKEKVVELKNLLEETYKNLEEIIRLVREDAEVRKMDSFYIFKEEGNKGIVSDLLADFTDAIDILRKEA